MTETMLQKLKDVLAQTAAPDGRFALAFSGGVDSRFLSAASRLLGFSPVLIHVRGVHTAGTESWGLGWAVRNGFELKEAQADILSVPEVRSGSKNRCYGCKLAAFRKIISLSGELPVCDGTNASDLSPGVYRPGVRALEELGIRSPLAEAGFTKTDIRSTARAIGLEAPDQPSKPCLLTRYPYGTEPTEEGLEKILRTETELESLIRRATGDSIPFRFRPVEPGRPEIHFEQKNREKISEGLEADMKKAASAICGVSEEEITVRYLGRLSGFYDERR